MQWMSSLHSYDSVGGEGRRAAGWLESSNYVPTSFVVAWLTSTITLISPHAPAYALIVDFVLAATTTLHLAIVTRARLTHPDHNGSAFILISSHGRSRGMVQARAPHQRCSLDMPFRM